MESSSSGEQYIPPPKRRRTAGQHRETRGETDTNRLSETPRRLSSAEEDDQSSALSEIASTAGSFSLDRLTDHSTEALAQFSDLQMDVFGNLDPDFDFNLRSNSFDLNFAGEGLDSIPLPVVDSSILHSSTELTQSPLLNVPRTSRVMDSVDQTIQPEPQNVPTDDASSFVSPTLDGTSQHLIQHYLDVMKGYSKVDDRPKNESNLFISAFFRVSLFPTPTLCNPGIFSLASVHPRFFI